MIWRLSKTSRDKSTLKWYRYLGKHNIDADNLKKTSKKFWRQEININITKRWKNEAYNVFTAEVNNNITLNDNNHKGIQLIDNCKGTCGYGIGEYIFNMWKWRNWIK